jgi:hypothetical protein
MANRCSGFGCHPMPRGRGRKRGISRTITPRRTNPSHTLQRRSALQDSIGSLRRSARVAASNAHRETRNTNSSMADVARRPRQSASRGHRGALERQRVRTNRQDRESGLVVSPSSRLRTYDGQNGQLNSREPAQNGYILDFVVAPPFELSTNSPVNPAVTLQVRTVHRGPNRDHSLHTYIAVATLMTTDGNEILAPAPPGTMGGPQMADSVHAPDLTVAGATSSDILGYISFPNLVIHIPGTYRLHVTLMRVGSTDGSEQGGTTLQTIDSSPIVVTNT